MELSSLAVVVPMVVNLALAGQSVQESSRPTVLTPAAQLPCQEQLLSQFQDCFSQFSDKLTAFNKLQQQMQVNSTEIQKLEQDLCRCVLLCIYIELRKLHIHTTHTQVCRKTRKICNVFAHLEYNVTYIEHTDKWFAGKQWGGGGLSWWQLPHIDQQRSLRH